ncbi:MAG: hypothetical protein ACOYXU_14820 [Nitrospirota bacterium]
MVGTLTALGVAMVVSLGLVFSLPADVGFAADKKPPKKSTKSSGKGLDDLKTPDVEVKASEGDTATAIRGKPGHTEGDEKGKENTATDSEAAGEEAGNSVPKK